MNDEQNEPAAETEFLDKPRRGRPPKDEPKAIDPNATATITYLPDDCGPMKTEWNGIRFTANVPVKVPLNKMVHKIPLRNEWFDPATGELRSKAREGSLSMVDLARSNPFFSVDGAPPPERKYGSAKLPTDENQYRSYAYEWIREAATLRQLDQRWDGEAALRERCGIDQRGENYLMPFVHARREQLREAA